MESFAQPTLPVFPDRSITVSPGESIQAAIDNLATLGGGTLRFLPGVYATGPLTLQSQIHLQLCENAVVSFTDQKNAYLPPVFTRWEGFECYNYHPLIYARNCTDLAITGPGRLLGNGQAWWPWKKLQQAAADRLYQMAVNNVPAVERIFGTEQDALRPSFIQWIDCSRVLLSDFTIEDGPQWTLHPVYCEDVTIENVSVQTCGPNTDGCNPDSCSKVLISDCHFSTGDDCIALNSGMNEDGWRVNRPCSDIQIKNCTMEGGHGAVTIGSAVSGGVRHVSVRSCRIYHTDQGIRIKSMRGRGGYVKDIEFSDLKISDTRLRAIEITASYNASTVIPATEKTSRFENISIKNVSGTGNAEGILLDATGAEPIRSISLSDITLTCDAQALLSANVEDLAITNLKITKA